MLHLSTKSSSIFNSRKHLQVAIKAVNEVDVRLVVVSNMCEN